MGIISAFTTSTTPPRFPRIFHPSPSLRRTFILESSRFRFFAKNLPPRDLLQMSFLPLFKPLEPHEIQMPCVLVHLRKKGTSCQFFNRPPLRQGALPEPHSQFKPKPQQKIKKKREKCTRSRAILAGYVSGFLNLLNIF